MKDTVYTRGLLPLALAACLGAVVPAAGAGIQEDCRQEAELYGVSPEQLDEYIDGCVLSRGGYPDPGNSEEFIAPPETDPAVDDMTGDTETPEPPGSDEGDYATQ